MGDILWGEREAGDSGAVGQDETGAYFIVGTPDWVRTPPELGGEQHRVARTYMRACPCGAGHESKTHELQCTTLQVSECERKGFLWWRPR